MRLFCSVVWLVLGWAHAYEYESHVLVLQPSDLPSLFQEFPYLMIKFYAPWCAFCKQLAPVYAKTAKLLAESNSPGTDRTYSVKLAKVDLAQHKEFGSGKFEVTGFPTLYFVVEGAALRYDGERSTEGIISWIDRRMTPRAAQIVDSDELSMLSEKNRPSLVLFSRDKADIQKFKLLSTQDSFNDYYVAVGDLARTYDRTVVEIHRSFDEMKTLEGINDRQFLHWRRKYQRALVAPFDNRTIYYIFQQEFNAAVLFNAQSNPALTKVLEEVSRNLNGDFIITELRVNLSATQPNNQNYKKLATFFKLRLTGYPQLIGLKSKQHKKAIFWDNVSKLTYSQLKDFITRIADGTEPLYPSESRVSEPQGEGNASSNEL